MTVDKLIRQISNATLKKNLNAIESLIAIYQRSTTRAEEVVRKINKDSANLRDSAFDCQIRAPTRVGLTREGYKSAALSFLMNEQTRYYRTRRGYFCESCSDLANLGGYPSQSAHPGRSDGIIRKEFLLRRAFPIERSA